ncbi:ribonuclease HI family protein [Planctomycetota bacterium]|nr:ribonuclease HI family protein [Planctomycetota bacterium]
MKCIIHIDGGARGNPGPAGAGVTITDAATKKPVHEAGYWLGTMTNNSAEYNGLLLCLQIAGEIGATDLLIHSDSQLMVRQINGEYKVKSADLKPLYTKALSLVHKFKNWELVHVRRAQNKRADELANMAMDAQNDVHVTGQNVSAGGTGSSGGAGGGGGLFEQSDRAGGAEAGDGKSLGANGFGVRFTTNDCQNGCKKGREFVFGDKTPGGCCVHAAATALSANPMKWEAGHSGDDMICNQCWQTIEVRKK